MRPGKDSRRVVNTIDNLSKHQDLTPKTLATMHAEESLILMADQEEIAEVTTVVMDHNHVM